MLRHLPIALTITKRSVDRYAWHWLEAQGEGESFTDALENALTHIETAYEFVVHTYLPVRNRQLWHSASHGSVFPMGQTNCILRAFA